MVYNNNKYSSKGKPDAAAPYNFVPLPAEPVAAPFCAQLTDKKLIGDYYRKHVTDPARLSGRIAFDITALTPVYINGGNRFFAPNGQPLIPGSTLRGLAKNLLKMISCGVMRQGEDFNDSYKDEERKADVQAISSHVPEPVRDSEKNTVDFAEAIFGRLDDGGGDGWASRVYFDDAYSDIDADDKNRVALLPPHEPHTLLGPNPGAYKLYLEQKDSNNLKKWSDKVNLRGYKNYWHQCRVGETGWHRGAKEKPLKDDNRIFQPAAANSCWKAQIRFSCLDEIELGALMAVIRLAGGNSAAKIGMGKPIGLGSVKFTNVKLTMIDRKLRYSSLFADEAWQSGAGTPDSGRKYQTAFEEYMEKMTEQQGCAAKYRDIRNSLDVMLDWKNAPALDNNDSCRQMKGDKFSKCGKLPTALDIGRDIGIVKGGNPSPPKPKKRK